MTSSCPPSFHTGTQTAGDGDRLDLWPHWIKWRTNSRSYYINKSPPQSLQSGFSTGQDSSSCSLNISYWQDWRKRSSPFWSIKKGSWRRQKIWRSTLTSPGSSELEVTTWWRFSPSYLTTTCLGTGLRKCLEILVTSPPVTETVNQSRRIITRQCSHSTWSRRAESYVIPTNYYWSIQTKLTTFPRSFLFIWNIHSKEKRMT